MLTFIDLFAGIGGFRIALENLGCKCVFSSEIDPYARKTYLENFSKLPENEDIRQLNENDVPEHDILCAGFPCQAFSIAGRKNGFEDARGTLFFEIARIINVKRPKAFLLENVQGLLTHDKGRTFKKILNVLEEDLNYFVPLPKILNAKDFGLPQNRPRIFIVGFREDLRIYHFSYPNSVNRKKILKEILENNEVSVKYYLSDQYLETLVKHKQRHKDKGNGFGYEVISPDGIANSLVVGGMGKERNLVVDNRLTNFQPVTRIQGEVNKSLVRRMTPREWARLQGFPDSFKIIVSDVQAYKQFGNSVAIPVVKAVAKEIINVLTLSVPEKNMPHSEDNQGKQLELFTQANREKIAYKKYNKGEWTEIYVLFYLLGQRKLYKGDVNFQRISDFFHINRVFHTERTGLIEFNIEELSSSIIIKKKGEDERVISIKEFDQKAKDLLSDIKIKQGSSFSLPDIEDFLKTIYCVSIKESSKNVKDIEIEIIDRKQDKYETLGFSIKSKLGSSSTIFNPNKKTNFIYRIEGINEDEIKELNELSSATQIIKNIKNKCTILFDPLKTQEETSTLYRNLIIVDNGMPLIVANLLLNFYTGANSNSITKLPQMLNPLIKLNINRQN